jgi:hypothetical protein
MSKKKHLNQNNNLNISSSAHSSPSSSPKSYKSNQLSNDSTLLNSDDEQLLNNQKSSKKFNFKSNYKSYLKWLSLLITLLIVNKFYLNYLNNDYNILVNKNKQLYEIVKRNYDHIAFASFHTCNQQRSNNVKPPTIDVSSTQAPEINIDTTTTVGYKISDLAIIYEEKRNETVKSKLIDLILIINLIK